MNKKLRILLIVLCLCGFIYITVSAQDANNTDKVEDANNTERIPVPCSTNDQGRDFKNIGVTVTEAGGKFLVTISNAQNTIVKDDSGTQLGIPGADGILYLNYNVNEPISLVFISTGLTFNNTEVKYEEDRIKITNDCNDVEVNAYTGSTNLMQKNEVWSSTECVNFRKKYANNDTVLKAVPPCNDQETQAQYDLEMVKSMISIAENLYGRTDNISVGTGTGKAGTEIKLQCDLTATSNVQTFYDVKTARVGDCETSCREEVTVTYGPPVATYAGGPVDYEITITSTTNCNSQYKGNPPRYKEVCVPKPVCEHNNGLISDKAGPNDEFDNCITSCDGGKYTQSCINQCYQKVYKKTSSNVQLLTYETKKMAYDWSSSCNATYNLRQNNPGGYYKGTSNALKWVSTDEKNCGYKNANRAGFYYYSSPELEAYTNERLNRVSNTSSWAYTVDDNGFLRINAGKNACNAECRWEGCDPSKTVLTVTERDKYNQEQLKKYQAAVNSCQGVQQKTNTTTYTMRVTNDVGNQKIKTEFYPKFEEKENEDKKGKTGTYTFPTAYINKETGKVIYDEKKIGNSNKYINGGNRFYTSLLSKDTHTNWYDWKLGYIGEDELNTDTTNNFDWNINAIISNFGMLNWKFNIDCFYALKNNYCPPDDTNCPDPDTDPDAKPKYMDYIFRPISLTDVFPASKEAWNGRAPRWNWSCSATNTRNKNYKITPVALTSDIEKKGYSIYDDANESSSLDYDIVLTRDTMQKVRAYNKTKDSYLDYDMTCSKVNGMEFCKSGLLTQLGPDVVKKRGLIGCNNQANGSTCNILYDSDNAQSCRTYFDKQVRPYDILTNKFK